MESIWTESLKEVTPRVLGENKNVDIAVIGGGIAGLLIAYLLKQEGRNPIILEGSRIASGQTHKTTAKITVQHNLIYDKLTRQFGKETAFLYAKANQEALNKYSEIIHDKNITCHFKRLPNYIYSLRDPKLIENEVKAAIDAGIKAEFTLSTTLPFLVDGAIKVTDQAQFNPAEFINGIVDELEIYENTMVYEVENNVLRTSHGLIKADHVVVATHYPFINAPGYYFLRLHQERSYVIALDNTPILDGMYLDEGSNGLSFRNYEDKLLLGGGGHRTGDNKYGGSYEKLRKAASEYYPNSQELYAWSAQDTMSLDSIPYIGRYSSQTPNMYVATGFNKWGMTSSMVSAFIIRDMIQNRKSPYEDVFTPQRFKVNASMANLLKEGKHAISGIVKEKFVLPDTMLKEIKPGTAGVIDYKDKKIGVYKDEKGKTYKVSTKCPHLGCQLEWNPDEKSWDCPCHGSRFDFKGDLLDNPAIKGMDSIKL